MAFDENKPANDGFLADAPAEIRLNQKGLRDDAIVNAQKLQGLIPGNAAGNVPIANGTLCAGLNAEKVGGNLPSAFAASGHTHGAVTGSANGLMLNTDKTKLDGIAAGAEVNQNAFSNVLIGGITLQADSKTDTLEIVAGTNIALTPDATNDRLTIALSGKVASAALADNSSALNGKADTAFAPASHGNHVPATGTADNATFLRNDNTFQKVTPANIGAAPASHTHDGSQISGTVANAANAATVGGLAVNTSGVNNVANQVARTNGSGYLMCGWINTPSGDVGTGATNSFFVDTGDGYIRKKTLANVKSELGVSSIPSSTSLTVTASTQGTITPTGVNYGEYRYSATVLNQSAGVAAGTYTLQAIVQNLVNLSHKHGTTSIVTMGANCNCGGGDN